MKTPKIIMTGGTGRCGKSVMKEVLSRHPDAASLPFEYRFIIDPDGIVDFYSTYFAAWSPYIADRRLKRLEKMLRELATTHPIPHLIGNVISALDPDGRFLSPARYCGWRLDRHLPNFEAHVETLVDRLTSFSFAACWPGIASYTRRPHLRHSDIADKDRLTIILREFLHGVINDFLEEGGKRFLVEDNTWNPLFGRELHALLPNAKLINVYRHPLDVVASFSQQRWCPDDRVQAAYVYESLIRRWWDVRDDLPAEFFYEVTLEELVRWPEETLRALCAFSDIPFSREMLGVDLSHAHSGRWHSEYTRTERRLIPYILSDIIEALGYE